MRNLKLDQDDVEVIVKLNKIQAEYINQLLKTGLYGNTPAECVRRLIDKRLIEIYGESINSRK